MRPRHVLLLNVLQQLHAQLILLQPHIALLLQPHTALTGPRRAGACCAGLRQPCYHAALMTGVWLFRPLLPLLLRVVSAVVVRLLLLLVAVGVRLLLLLLLLLALQEQRETLLILLRFVCCCCCCYSLHLLLLLVLLVLLVLLPLPWPLLSRAPWGSRDRQVLICMPHICWQRHEV